MSAQPAQANTLPGWLVYAGLLLVLSLVIAAGYFGFRAFATAPALSSANLYIFAMVAGVASFFSPCAFPLLPSYFSFYQRAARRSEGTTASFGVAVSLGLTAALGVMTFAVILGLVIALLGAGVAQGLSISSSAPSIFVRAFRGVVGALLVTLGIAQLLGWNLKPRLVDALAFYTRPKRDGSMGSGSSLYLYGLGYNAAGMGCTGPILAGLVIVGFASGGATAALGAFVVFALTMGALMLVVSILVAASEETLLTRMKVAAPKLARVASYALILAGVFNLYTAANLPLFLDVFFP